METRSRSLFGEVFVSVPRPVRHILHAALQLQDLQDLHARACLSLQQPVSRAALELLGVSIRVSPSEIGRVPVSGPLVVVANHPFGILDGLILDALLFDVRRDVKLLTNSLVANAGDIGERCIPVNVFDHATSSMNLRAVRRAREWLRDGHCVAVFPAGQVSHWQRERYCISDPPWSHLAARLVFGSHADTIPVYFAGSNSLAFQLAGIVHPNMRTVRLPRELLNKRGSTVEVRIGTRITSSELARQGSNENATSYLRARTYMLGYRPAPRQLSHATGVSRAATIPVEIPGIDREIGELEEKGCKIIENGSFSVFAAPGSSSPALLGEIGRLRELTFRGVGEGTGKAVDLDSFDRYYTQLVLWHKEKRCIAGGYRLAWTEDVLRDIGIRGLYTSTLFRFTPAFFQAIGPAVELGRSYIRPEFQKDYAPLLLMWQAIAHCVANRPQAPVLFGPVSISANYSDAAMELIVEFLRQRRLRPDLASLVTPRRPFRSRLTRAADIRQIAACLSEIDELAIPLAEIGSRADVPILLRQYVRLGGRVAAFNVDRNFSNALDGLLVLDLRDTAPKLLARYMGAATASEFLLCTSITTRSAS